jgi:hypothetical protein
MTAIRWGLCVPAGACVPIVIRFSRAEVLQEARKIARACEVSWGKLRERGWSVRACLITLSSDHRTWKEAQVALDSL